ncbi:hypothetical protein [uncultured Anaerococcus sp.]|nr:hypothetical protein [uncultured Anaerococcus sp.]
MTEKQSSKTVSIRTKGDAEELFKSIAKDLEQFQVGQGKKQGLSQ